MMSVATYPTYLPLIFHYDRLWAKILAFQLFYKFCQWRADEQGVVQVYLFATVLPGELNPIPVLNYLPAA